MIVSAVSLVREDVRGSKQEFRGEVQMRSKRREVCHLDKPEIQ